MEENKEITKSIGQMIDSKNIETIQLASAIIKAQPDMIDNDTLKGHWYNIHDIINPQTIQYTELYCSDGRSDKVYIVLLNKMDNNKFHVKTCYGKRGASLKHIGKITTSFLSEAERMFNKVVKDKLKHKGYKQL
jgi:hypothetical protein